MVMESWELNYSFYSSVHHGVHAEIILVITFKLYNGKKEDELTHLYKFAENIPTVLKRLNKRHY